jgi:hypothetical protein
MPTDQPTSHGFHSWPALGISILSLAVSAVTSYYALLKPFDMVVTLQPQIQIQHKVNFGIYLSASFVNKSPSNGTITNAALVTYKDSSPDDKYLLNFMAFRVLDKATETYGEAQESLPIFLKPGQIETRTMNFIYFTEKEMFPISTGTYVCELLLWIDAQEKPTYKKQFKFDLSADLLQYYLLKRSQGSTTLSPPIELAGFSQLTARKLNRLEYNQLF